MCTTSGEHGGSFGTTSGGRANLQPTQDRQCHRRIRLREKTFRLLVTVVAELAAGTHLAQVVLVGCQPPFALAELVCVRAN